MPPYDIFFFGALFFLIGVLLASLHLKFWILAIAAVLFLGSLFYGALTKRHRFIWIGGLSLLIILGSLYYTWHDLRFQKEANLIFNERTSFSGVVVTNPKISSNVQEFVIEAHEPFRGRILVKTVIYPRYSYGDELDLEAVIKPTSRFSKSYAQYLEKEKINGLVSFPKVKVLAQGRGSPVKSFLFGVRNRIAESFSKVLSSDESAFLSGLTLGGMQGLSKSFKEAMHMSGTTHLVALSGYNISIIIMAVMGLFVYFFSRRLSFIFATLVILGFVLMTGAEASVVRAAIMGFLVLLAGEVGRFFDFRNAIIFAGLLMVLQNPKVLVFDIGFQLSFLALVGIIYLKPAIEKFLLRRPLGPKDKGFLNWRENLLTTISAQIMVAPLLIAQFNNFSLTSFAANVLILELVPVTMALGFLIAALSLVSYYLSLIVGWIVFPLLRLEIFVIEIFAKISLPLRPAFGFISSVIYYILVIAFIVYVGRYVKMARKA